MLGRSHLDQGNHEVLDGFVLIDILSRFSGLSQTNSSSIDLLLNCAMCG